MQFIQSEQVDLALAGKPNNLPTGLEFYKIDDISLSLIAPRVACLATQLLQEEPYQLATDAFYFAVRWNGTPAY